MQGFDDDKIKDYTNLICEQVRWKKAHRTISQEIENHILDQKEAFVSTGLSETEAIEKAVKEMGDPVKIGAQFDRTHRPKIEWSMIILTLMALSAGLIINFFVQNANPQAEALFYFYRTAIVTFLGIICMIVAYFIDFSILGKYPRIIFIAFVICIIILAPFTDGLNGSPHFIIGFESIPLGTLLLLFPCCYGGIIYSMREKGYTGIILCGIFFVVPTTLFLILQINVSRIIVCALTCLILLSISILKKWFNVKKINGMLVVFIPTLITSFLLIGYIITSQGYRAERIQAFVDPYSDPLGVGYIIMIIRSAIDGANFFGEGSPLPRYPSGDLSAYLPAINTEYLLTYLIYKIGWISFWVILALLLTFVSRGFYLCFKQKSILGQIISVAVLLTLSTQMLIYISANLGLQVLSQPHLPFISYGGYATIINLTLIGLMLSVFKSGDLYCDRKKNRATQDKFLEFTNGKIIIHLY